MIIGALGTKWPLAKYRNCCRVLEENIIAPLFKLMLKLEWKSPKSRSAIRVVNRHLEVGVGPRGSFQMIARLISSVSAGLLWLWCKGGRGGRARPDSLAWLPVQLLLWDTLRLAVLCACWLPAHSGNIWLWCVWKPQLCCSVRFDLQLRRGGGGGGNGWRGDFSSRKPNDG